MSEGVDVMVNLGWYFATPEVDPSIRGVLVWEMERPSPCTFEVAIEARRLRPVLQAVASEGLVGLSTEWPCPGEAGFNPTSYVIVPTSRIKGLLMALAWTAEEV